MYTKKGDILNERETLELAIQAYEMAYRLDPTKDFLLGNLIFTKNKSCDWNNYDEKLKVARKRNKNKKKFPHLL